MPDRRVLTALIVLAISARVAAIFVLGGHQVRHATYEHGEIAENLLAGRGFSVMFLGADGPTSQQAPLYPVAVAGAYALGGAGTPRALLILELAQAVLGGVLVLAVAMLAAEVAPGRPIVAYLGGLIVAVHPTLVYAATHIQVASMAAALVAGCLAWGYRLGRTGRTGDAIAAGTWLAILALTDPILGLVAFGMAWAAVRGLGWRGSIRPLAVLCLTCAIGVAPWVVRNALVHGEFVPVKSSFGYAFWQGNCALSEGTDKVVRASVEPILEGAGGSLRDQNRALWRARHEAGYLDDIALTRDDYRTMAAMTEPARSRYLFRKALDDLRADPTRYPRLCLRRLRYFILFDETNPKTRNRLYRVSHLGLTALAVLGVVLAPRDLRRRLGPTFLAAGLITAFHALTIVSARFHLPIEPVMAVWAASGAARWSQPRVPT
ncbi:hypothetical protein TA3x_001871 [Tundrisphaera sp. TA3]|uniref:hypothetical protein n=1 Tax=Tundrisphaera sp. TA3 TaxID=3435775 RepID=UPI003EBF2411